MFIHNLKCKFYYLIKKKDKIVGYKWATLTKHISHRIIVFVLPMLNMIVKNGGGVHCKRLCPPEKTRLYA